MPLAATRCFTAKKISTNGFVLKDETSRTNIEKLKRAV